MSSPRKYGLQKLLDRSSAVTVASIASGFIRDGTDLVMYRVTPVNILKGQPPNVFCVMSRLQLPLGKPVVLFLLAPDQSQGLDTRCRKYFMLAAGFAFEDRAQELYGDKYLKVSTALMSLIVPEAGSLKVKAISYSSKGLLAAPELADEKGITTHYLVKWESFVREISNILAEQT